MLVLQYFSLISGTENPGSNPGPVASKKPQTYFWVLSLVSRLQQDNSIDLVQTAGIYPRHLT